MQTVRLMYFKKSGKYYSNATYQTEHSFYKDLLIIDEVRKLRRDGILPGLVSGAREFHVVITPESQVPHLLLLEDED